MSIKKYGLLTILTYFIVFFVPAFLPSKELVILGSTVLYLLGAFIMIILYLFSEKSLSFEQKMPQWFKLIVLGLVSIFLSILLQSVAATIETMLFNVPTDSENTQNILKLIYERPFFILAVTIGGPIMEEFVFRRAIVGLIQKRTPLWFAIAVSNLLFAVMHMDGHILLYMSLGLFFSFLYYRTGRIWTSMITHVGMNSFVVLVSTLMTTS